MFFDYVRSNLEPGNFIRFVSSFALLTPVVNTLPRARPPNAGSSLLLILAIAGAVADWNYKRCGGVGPSVRDRVCLLAAVLLCVGLVTLLGLLGATAELVGFYIGMLTVLLFAGWELGRWLVRRKYPVLSSLPPKG
jgi:hypothetical protein